MLNSTTQFIPLPSVTLLKLMRILKLKQTVCWQRIIKKVYNPHTLVNDWTRGKHTKTQWESKAFICRSSFWCLTVNIDIHLGEILCNTFWKCLQLQVWNRYQGSYRIVQLCECDCKKVLGKLTSTTLSKTIRREDFISPDQYNYTQ